MMTNIMQANKAFLLLFIILAYTQAQAEGSSHQPWTIHFDFDDGVEGERASEFNSAAGGTLYSKEQSYKGGQGTAMHATRGKENFGKWGGIINFPENLHKGDELWWRIHTYWPEGVDYSANPFLKFLRVHTRSASVSNFGYNDLYISPPNAENPLRWIYEGEPKWTIIGAQADKIRAGEWETYEYYLKFDNVSVDDGGEGRARIWKNGVLLADITNGKTLKEADGFSANAYLFTYWNSSPWIGQMVYENNNGTSFILGELVSSDANPSQQYIVDEIGANVVYIRDPEPNWTERVKPQNIILPGEILTGESSATQVTVSNVLHSHPTMDIKMYVDEITLTTQRPSTTDANGNPYLGLLQLSVFENSFE